MRIGELAVFARPGHFSDFSWLKKQCTIPAVREPRIFIKRQSILCWPLLSPDGYFLGWRQPPSSLEKSMSPRVGIVMGSKSDWETMRHAEEMLNRLRIPCEVRVISAHRTPDLLYAYAGEARQRGIEIIIAGAGGAAHLPGMIAAKTILPVLGVPVQSKTLNGLDSLLSIVQMPAGIPVGTLAIGTAGAANAALLAASILAIKYPEYAGALEEFRNQQTEAVLSNPDPRKSL
jgi:5-(carboxyamino)imidazole ribonucleotide mutase